MSTDAQSSKEIGKIGASYGYTKAVREQISKYKLSLSTYQIGGLPVTDSRTNVGTWGENINANPGVIAKSLKTMDKIFHLKLGLDKKDKISAAYHFWVGKYFDLESRGINHSIDDCETTTKDIELTKSHLNLYEGIHVRCTKVCNGSPKIGTNENYGIIFEKTQPICVVAKWWGYEDRKIFTIKYFRNVDDEETFVFNDKKTGEDYKHNGELTLINSSKQPLPLKLEEEYVTAYFWERRIDYSNAFILIGSN